MFSGVRKPGRVMTALMALCYAFLSLVLPAHHTAGDADDVRALVCVASSVHSPLPIRTKLSAQVPSHSGRCLACEWQASNVSVAVPLFSIPPPRVQSASIPDARLKSHCTLAVATSSRAPPVA